MAGVKLHLATTKIWEYFFENIDRLQDNEDCIAESNENNMSLYLTASTIFPQLVLYRGNKAVLYRNVANADECNKWAIYLIMKYVADVLTEGTPDAPKKEDEPKVIELPMKNTQVEVEPEPYEEDDYEDTEEQKQRDMIYEREDELAKAMGDLLAVILFESDCNAVTEVHGTAMVNECVDDFLQYLAEKHELSVYRPTFGVDPETGEEVFMEFPYGWDEDYDE